MGDLVPPTLVFIVEVLIPLASQVREFGHGRRREHRRCHRGNELVWRESRRLERSGQCLICPVM